VGEAPVAGEMPRAGYVWINAAEAFTCYSGNVPLTPLDQQKVRYCTLHAGSEIQSLVKNHPMSQLCQQIIHFTTKSEEISYQLSAAHGKTRLLSHSIIHAPLISTASSAHAHTYTYDLGSRVASSLFYIQASPVLRPAFVAAWEQRFAGQVRRRRRWPGSKKSRHPENKSWKSIFSHAFSIHTRHNPFRTDHQSDIVKFCKGYVLKNTSLNHL
jgi:hypothetical protein